MATIGEMSVVRHAGTDAAAHVARHGDGVPATSVVQVPAMPVPACRVTMDMWAVAG